MLTEPLDSLESIGRSPRSEMERSGIELGHVSSEKLVKKLLFTRTRGGII